VDRAAHTQRKFFELWRVFGMVPERLMLTHGTIQQGHAGYPLRPELAESLYYLHRATNDSEWLHMGRDMVTSLLASTKVPCGHAAIKDVRTHARSDNMNSYFLAETVKYLYLLFDIPGSARSNTSVLDLPEMNITVELPKDAVRFSAVERDLRDAFMHSLKRDPPPTPSPARETKADLPLSGVAAVDRILDTGGSGAGVHGVKVEAAFGFSFYEDVDKENQEVGGEPESGAVKDEGAPPQLVLDDWHLHPVGADVSRDYIFTTEGHLIPLRLAQSWRGGSEERSNETAWAPFIDTFEHKGGDFVLRRSCDRPRRWYQPRGPEVCPKIPLYEDFPLYVDLADEVWGMKRRPKVTPHVLTTQQQAGKQGGIASFFQNMFKMQQGQHGQQQGQPSERMVNHQKALLAEMAKGGAAGGPGMQIQIMQMDEKGNAVKMQVPLNAMGGTAGSAAGGQAQLEQLYATVRGMLGGAKAAATGPPQIASTEQHEEQIEKTKQEVHTADTVPFDEI